MHILIPTILQGTKFPTGAVNPVQRVWFFRLQNQMVAKVLDLIQLILMTFNKTRF